jgi:CubicO group peptidase (beta-lactamase class C family)
MKPVRSIITLLVAFGLSCYGVKAQGSSNTINARLDSLMQEATGMNLFSGNVLVAHDGQVVYEKSLGKADYEKNIPNSPATTFQVGSITKNFTNVMVRQLAEQHKLFLTDTIGKFLPGFSAEVSAVTVNQLLAHRSGLGSYQETTEDMDALRRVQTIADIIPFLQKEKLQFKPGSNARYSNSGYVILAAIIEKATGKNYSTVLKELILDKLGMKHTFFNAWVKPDPAKATGYLTNSMGPMQSNDAMHIIGGGDGGIYMTTHDLLTFITSLLYDNKLLTNESKMMVFTDPFRPSPYKDWDDFTKTGRMALAGGAPGLSAMWSANMATRNIFIVFSNYDQGTAEAIGMRIGAILNNKPLQPLKQPAAKYLYGVINAKGGKYFEENYKAEQQNSGMAPDDDMVLLDVGRALLQDNKNESAISLYKVYTAEFPQIIVAWNDLGDAYVSLGDKPNARKCYEHALTLRPNNQRAKEALARLK